MKNPYTDWPGDRLFETKRNGASTQAKSCWGCLHVRDWVVYLWVTNKREYGWRLQILTPLRRFRWNSGRWAS